ncbi:hypothetical protein [Actinoplanes sp. NBRC 101535]|uniref:hypothetical protein n=1 Tax=Actinoplanes sp. NBRC 101535 TaxID=3032196 RepID=UPI002555DF64|nr:hypothetical protein [Actinoplanes sp. NBRC 101535]
MFGGLVRGNSEQSGGVVAGGVDGDAYGDEVLDLGDGTGFGGGCHGDVAGRRGGAFGGPGVEGDDESRVQDGLAVRFAAPCFLDSHAADVQGDARGFDRVASAGEVGDVGDAVSAAGWHDRDFVEVQHPGDIGAPDAQRVGHPGQHHLIGGSLNHDHAGQSGRVT